MIQVHSVPLLSREKGIFSGICSRHGGCSPAPYKSLNVSFGVGDSVQNVSENRQRIQDYFKIKTLISARQVHGRQVAVITASQDSSEIDMVDALVCSAPGVGIMIQQADCQAVLLYDPRKKIVAGIHSGWKGSVVNIIQETINVMNLSFGCVPDDLLAGISPSLGPCCAEFIHYKTELPKEMHGFQVRPNYFDFWAISKKQLLDAGLHEENIDITGICTRCSDDYFSYRRNRETGRFCSVIGLSHE
jgi:YfiH family protein